MVVIQSESCLCLIKPMFDGHAAQDTLLHTHPRFASPPTNSSAVPCRAVTHYRSCVLVVMGLAVVNRTLAYVARPRMCFKVDFGELVRRGPCSLVHEALHDDLLE